MGLVIKSRLWNQGIVQVGKILGNGQIQEFPALPRPPLKSPQEWGFHHWKNSRKEFCRNSLRNCPIPAFLGSAPPALGSSSRREEDNSQMGIFPARFPCPCPTSIQKVLDVLWGLQIYQIQGNPLQIQGKAEKVAPIPGTDILGFTRAWDCVCQRKKSIWESHGWSHSDPRGCPSAVEK